MTNNVKRTLDIFYLAQIVAGIHRYDDQLVGDFPSIDQFDTFYAEHHQLLNQDAWRQYYSPAFLAQASSARFYRLPNLQDLPDSSDPELGTLQQRGIGHFTKLPRWAYTVTRIPETSATLSVAFITQIALSSLQQTTLRLRKDHPGVQAYSATQASFWLKYMGFSGPISKKKQWGYNGFDVYAAQGGFNMWAWEAHYSPKLWYSMEAQLAPLEGDLDGTRKSELRWCGLPEGYYVGEMSRLRGWLPEVGSEEEIEFLTAVAVKEAESIEVSNWDHAMRSHMLPGVIRFAFETEREKHMENLKRWIVAADIIDESKVEQWIQQVWMVMEPYVQKWNMWPAAVEDQSGLLRHILLENAQLFGRWKLSPTSKEFDFGLKPKE